MANQHGWELLSPCSFEALWTGSNSSQGVQVVGLGGQGRSALPESHFGWGILTFYPDHLFRTDPGYSLVVCGPPNSRKDGIVPLMGIVETDWLPFPFTMNWAFTRVGVPIRFEEGEPFCHLFPVPRQLVQETVPEIGDLESDARLKSEFDAWTSRRMDFVAERQLPESDAAREGWQRFYTRGTTATGESPQQDHLSRLRVRPFLRTNGAGETSPLPARGAHGCPRHG
jgi:hypothetical protein